jgi:hypothetical protein
MKKLLGMSLLALAMTCLSQQQAQAWSKFHFGAGFNLDWEAGGNSFGWGLYRGGPAPGQDMVYPTQDMGHAMPIVGAASTPIYGAGHDGPANWTAPSPAPAAVPAPAPAVVPAPAPAPATKDKEPPAKTPAGDAQPANYPHRGYPTYLIPSYRPAQPSYYSPQQSYYWRSW